MTKLNKKNIIITIFLLVWFVIFIYSGIKIFIWYKESKNAKLITEEISKIAKVSVDNSENIEIVNNNENEQNININLIDVNIPDLKNINSDTVGWIQVAGTNIDYPFVQTIDNNFYLKHSFNKDYSNAGWVFLDYRNNIDKLDKNTIIYAHNREDKIMFNSLNNLLEQNWFENEENHVIKISTENENSLWQIFSVYHIKTTDDYIKVEFNNDEEYDDFLTMIKNRSIYNFQTEPNHNDKILTLSTCYNRSEKLVVHAKMIKHVLKNK